MKTYVVVGVGSRWEIFRNTFNGEHKDKGKLLAICDKNKGRLNLAQKQLQVSNQVASYEAFDFDLMLRTHNPNVVIVCSQDSTHADYIVRALNSGCDVITEKPMAINQKGCRDILKAETETGRNIQVLFNYRYSPARSHVKGLLLDGVIGEILSINFQWLLDTSHGADYFRRWHRKKDNSGGLLVHKSTHHFDLVNWWTRSAPKKVYAQAKRKFYNEQQAKLYDLSEHGKRCLDCSVSQKCNFYLDIKNVGWLKELYYDHENFDGYVRDQCVFDKGIDIEDTMHAIVEYENGILLNYSLHAFMPWEGYRVEFNGTKGRLEHTCRESSYVNGDGTTPGQTDVDSTGITIYPHFRTSYEVKIEKSIGGHGGGDTLMLADLFDENRHDDLGRKANHIAGARSILTGIAANKSIETNEPVLIRSLVASLKQDKYEIKEIRDDVVPYVKNARRVMHTS